MAACDIMYLMMDAHPAQQLHNLFLQRDAARPTWNGLATHLVDPDTQFLRLAIHASLFLWSGNSLVLLLGVAPFWCLIYSVNCLEVCLAKDWRPRSTYSNQAWQILQPERMHVCRWSTPIPFYKILPPIPDHLQNLHIQRQSTFIAKQKRWVCLWCCVLEAFLRSR